MHETEAGRIFGQRLRELREKRHLTQQQLADAVGIPHTHVSSLERGLLMPTLLTILRLAAALECKVSTLTSVFDKTDLQALLRQ
jgi:transcriptional regulator with XRE-family HTH domain